MIRYGDIEFDDDLYYKAMENTRKSKDGHWIFYGAKSGDKNHPQIGAMGIRDGERKLRVVSVAKLIWSIHNGGLFPYQLRKNREVCKEKLCVKPECFYPIMSKVEAKEDGE